MIQNSPIIYEELLIVRGGETMDNFAYTVMQILTVVLLVGTLGLSFFVGKIMKKNAGY